MSTKKKNYDSYFKDVEKFYKIKSDYENKYKKEKNRLWLIQITKPLKKKEN